MLFRGTSAISKWVSLAFPADRRSSNVNRGRVLRIELTSLQVILLKIVNKKTN